MIEDHEKEMMDQHKPRSSIGWLLWGIIPVFWIIVAVIWWNYAKR